MDVLRAASDWLEQDPDPETKAELSKLIEEKNLVELAERFGRTLEFGTAGLRGELGAGPNRMNRIVVARAAWAIGQYLINAGDTFANNQGELSVVIGYDARINSDVFAKDSAEVLSALGIKVHLFDHAVPTPVTAFTGKDLSASAAIMVTASHNPPRDNGYKVYLGGPNGHSQLVSPADAEIANYIQQVSETHTFQEIEKSSTYEVIGSSQISKYISRAIELDRQEDSELSIVYTPLHGVGWAVMQPILEGLGYGEVHQVTEQIKPDGLFPTVAFPNPEEKGAMDLAYQTATRVKADIVIANDPDADRLAVAVPSEQGWRMLTGDEIGLLLGEQVAKSGAHGTFANSIVSSELLGKVAEHYRLGFVQTLTGFKWISKTPNLCYGYEEALGYCVDPSHTPDKDGITAAVMILGLARDLKKTGSNLTEYLDKLFERYGFVQTGQISIRVEDLAVIKKIMKGLRESAPQSLGNWSVEYQDLKEGKQLPPTDGIVLSNSEIRMIVRPSGTEPKLKCYLLARGSSAEAAKASLTSLREAANSMLNALQ